MLLLLLSHEYVTESIDQRNTGKAHADKRRSDVPVNEGSLLYSPVSERLNSDARDSG